GDGTNLTSQSPPIIESIATSATPDFTLTISAPQTVIYGAAASYDVTLTPSNGVLASPILLTVSGLPADAIATFAPSSVQSGATISLSTLRIQTGVTSAERDHSRKRFISLAVALPLVFFSISVCFEDSTRKRRQGIRTSTFLGLLCVVTLSSSGCGQAPKQTTQVIQPPTSYSVTVTGTSGTLQHTTTTTLTVTTNEM
ncbi:MAG TPA: hypothetical protein VH079_05615, partial [Terriglobales bacterium]|nr:hypothetical protein [Terriglobales bacterium]